MCQDCGWEEYDEKIDDLLTGDDFAWAEETLGGIQEWIRDHQHITENQKDAVDNIESRGR